MRIALIFNFLGITMASTIAVEEVERHGVTAEGTIKADANSVFTKDIPIQVGVTADQNNLIMSIVGLSSSSGKQVEYNFDWVDAKERPYLTALSAKISEYQNNLLLFLN